MYCGSWKIDDLFTFTVNTHRFDTGAATDADSAPTYRVYEDETSTPIVTGTMALLDSANTAGFYSEQVTLSAANGFEKGKSYNIYIQGAVNSVTASTSRYLQIEAEVDANTVSPTVVNVNVTQISGDSTAADNLESYTDGTTPMPVNVTQISGDTTSADNLESYTDGTTPIPANITQISGDSTAADNLEAYTDGTTPQPVNTTQLSGDATAADNAESFFDGTGYAGTNNVIPTVTDVTTKTGYSLSSAGVDAILDDAPAAELAAIPTTTSSLRQMVQFVFQYFRNKRTVTASTETLFKEDASTSLGTSTLTDDGTTFTHGEIG